LTYVKLNGLIAEVLARGGEVDLVEFLADELQLPLFKAEALAERIKKQCSSANPASKPIRYVVEKATPAEQTVPSCAYAVDCLAQREFERFMRWLLGELGYNVEGEAFPATLGMDLVAQKDGEHIVVLARRYPKTIKVTDAIILAAQDALRIYQCSRALVIATASFTQQATDDAQACGVELWDMVALAERINQARQKTEENPQSAFPLYRGSLLQSLRALGDTKTFLIETRAAEKYDLILPGVKYPLLTFQVMGEAVVGCVYRIKYNEPVSESEGEVIIGGGAAPSDEAAYGQIVEYLEQFIE
jgi:HJR/Mrr/RecB family endonuclease